MDRERFFFLSPDLLATAGPDGHFVELNPAWTRCLGWSLEELRARPWIEFVHPDDVGRTLALRETAGGEEVIHFENRYRHKDGGYRWLAWSASRRIDGTAYLIARDITDAKRVESELRAHGERLHTEAQLSATLAGVASELLSSVATPGLLDRLVRLTAEALGCDASYIFLWDEDAQAYVAMASHGASAEQWEVLRAVRFPLSVVGPLQEPLERGEIAHVLRAQAPLKLQEEIFKPFEVRALMVCALRRGSRIIGVLNAVNRSREVPFSPEQQRTIQGIAQLGSFALENARLFAELEQANRFRSDFVATMSHELRTPISVILGYHEMLLDNSVGSLAPAQADTVRRAQRSAAQLLDVVNATLDLSRFEARHIPLALEQVSAQRLLDEVAADITLPTEREALEVIWVPAPRDLVVRTDVLKARMVLKNLVGNAIKFTARGCVTIGADGRDGGVEFSVRDTGIGIAPCDHEAIFEPFRQVDGTAVRHGGAGLGLYIVRRLLVALGGTISVESALGHGTTFRVWLPVDGEREQRPT